MTIRLVLVALLLCASPAVGDEPAHWHSAPTPPLGWNSWDIFGTTITEKQAREQADAMAKHLLPAGYRHFTVDIQWYEPEAQGHVYRPGAPLEMDSYSRLLPAVKRFPSAANGAGFKPLADYVHSRGLQFGIHMMRGIPRQAVHRNTAIMGTTARAADIANTSSTCPWNPDMYGVDMSQPGAQQYYNSLFQLYASWGVDFIKVDDIARPYDTNQQAEIEAIRRAIDNSGRRIVLSLSPGATPLERGRHVMQYANMWRISDDFWDRWEPLYDMFERLERWTPYRAPGAWPDADMLPFGVIEFGRATHFTEAEQQLCMSLWCIARSPLIFGGDMTRLDPFTLQLLTSPEVLAVHQSSAGNRQVSRSEDLIVWAANVPGSEDRYVGLFNVQSDDQPFDLSQATFRSRTLRGAADKEAIDVRVAIPAARRLVLAVDSGGDNNFFDHAAWLEPTLQGPAGKRELTDLSWTLARCGWGQVLKNRTADNRPLTHDGRPCNGIGTHAVSVIEFELPAGYDTFTARGVLTTGSQGKGSVQFLVLVDPVQQAHPERNEVAVPLDQLGLGGPVRARDLWAGNDLGTYQDTFSQVLARHSGGLYRLSPVAKESGKREE